MIGNIDFVKSKAQYEKLTIRSSELASLSALAYGTNRTTTRWSYKVCPTRHGCEGATNCDRSYGDYHK